jgi:hypothetical protein
MSDYIRGEMDISEHKATFDGVMSVSVYVGLITAVVVLYLTLVFCGVTGWFSGLVVTVVVGGLGGFALNQGVAYWVSLFLFALITVICGAIVPPVFGFLTSAFGG